MKALFLLFVFLHMSPASGATVATGDIRFTFSGTASGSIDSLGFSNRAFEILVAANRSSASQVTPEVRQILAVSATIGIEGIGLGAIFVDLRLFQSPFVSFPPGGPAGSETVGLGLASGPDLLNLFHPAFADYDLVSDLGETFVATPQFQSRLAFNDIPSELGALTLSDTSNVSFLAAQIPEPAMPTLAVLGSIGGLLRRNRMSTTVA